jgi:ATP-dependent DNA ligase
MPSLQKEVCVGELLPTLYKKTSTGALQFWNISIVHGVQYSTIIVRYGQEGTDSPQVTKDLIDQGKNIGRANETTREMQSELEALARWEKQVKKGYTANRDKALKGEDEIGGVLPMLAHVYSDHSKKISYPALVQPKLDGVRCIAVVTGTGAKLYSRTRKPITSMKHIEYDLFEIWKATGSDFILDGELYTNDLKDNFEKIVSIVRKEDYSPEEAKGVQYHVYDIVNQDNAYVRQQQLKYLLMEIPVQSDYIVLVNTYLANSQTEMYTLYDGFLEQGYEGAIVRQMNAKYEHKRSYGLQKVKAFLDSEFKIVGVREGRGRMAGHGIFVCETLNGAQFDVKMSGDMDKLKEVLQNSKEYVGKLLTVQYQGFSNKNNVPRFPVGLRIREVE